MGTITERKKKDGTASFTAQIRRKEGGKVTFTEAKTFVKRKVAEAWLAKREAELDSGDPIPATTSCTFDELIDRYLKGREDQNAYGVLNRLKGSFLGNKPIDQLTTKDYSDFLKERLKTIKPQSVMSDLVYIRQATIAAKIEFGMDIDLGIIEEVKMYARRSGWVCQSNKRNRRITSEEYEALMNFFDRSKYQLPMKNLIDFALASCRRINEITRIRWEDLNEEKRTCVVRDLKHPRKKIGNNKTFKLTPEGFAIIQAQPRTGEFIFPYNHNSISNAFFYAVRMCGIVDLHFHDLRHEAITRLFERGYAIHEVALFSLHTNWNTLQRYTHLKAEDVVDK